MSCSSRTRSSVCAALEHRSNGDVQRNLDSRLDRLGGHRLVRPHREYVLRGRCRRRHWTGCRAVIGLCQPHVELTAEQAVSHRLRVTRAQPHLPARAGRGFAQLYALFEEAAAIALHADDEQAFFDVIWHHTRPATVVVNAQTGRRVTVRGARKAEPDYNKLAHAVVEFVVEQQKPKRDDLSPPKRAA
jgi:hypothetical protein